MHTQKEMGALTLNYYINYCLLKLIDSICIDEVIEHTYECYVMHEDYGDTECIDTFTVQVVGDCYMAKIFCGTKEEVTLFKEEMFELFGFFNGIYQQHRVLTPEEREHNEKNSGVPSWELPF